MGISVLNSAQTTAAAATLTITSATAGNLLVMFISQTGSLNLPSGRDNIGSAGWSTNSTFSTNSTTSGGFVAYKMAVGGETTLNPTAGSGSSIAGIAYFEIVGISAVSVDTTVATNDSTSITSLTSNSVTTTNAGDIILAAVCGVNSLGAINAWTGTGPMANITTASSNMIGGYYIPGITLSGATFTANWTTSRTPDGMMLVALKAIPHELSLLGVGA